MSKRSEKPDSGRRRAEVTPEEYPAGFFKDGIKGKYHAAYNDKHAGRQAALAPDVARAFPDDQTVNEALRLVRQLREVGQG